MLWLFRNRRRNKLAREPFPAAWRPVVDRCLPFAKHLHDEARGRFETHLKVFLWDTHWEGAGGLELDDTVRVVVSASAARIARNLSLHVYDKVREVVVYPGHYKHESREGHIIYGEAHDFGTVVLSWDAVERGVSSPRDGHDTAIHEFAHMLDIVDGSFDGTPELRDRKRFRQWVRVFSTRYEQLRRRPNASVMRAYGATNAAEFFAVATETFFERPFELRDEKPDVFDVLQDFYQLDPREEHGRWRPGGRSLARRDRKRS